MIQRHRKAPRDLCMRLAVFWLLTATLLALPGLSGRAQKGDAEPKVEVKKDADPFEAENRRQQDAAEADRKLLQENQVEPTDQALLSFFRRRTLPESDRPRIAELVDKLASADYRQREAA